LAIRGPQLRTLRSRRLQKLPDNPRSRSWRLPVGSHRARPESCTEATREYGHRSICDHHGRLMPTEPNRMTLRPDLLWAATHPAAVPVATDVSASYGAIATEANALHAERPSRSPR